MLDIDIYGIENSRLDEAWPEISPFIQLGLDFANGEMDLHDIYEMIEENKVVPIVMSHSGEVLAVVTMEVVQKPQKRIMCLMTAGGVELDQWLDEFMDVALNLAIEQCCDAIYINGRPGWARKLKRYGYEQRYVVLTRELQ